MTPLEWIVVAGCMLIGGAWLLIVPRIWQNRWRGLPEDAPHAWPYGQALWRGFVRVGAIGGAFAFVGAAGLVSERVQFGEPLESALDIAVHIIVPPALLIVWTVILFNWPKRIIPPHMRGEPGAIGEWMSSRRSRREALDGR
jgi:hypothetical protein